MYHAMQGGAAALLSPGQMVTGGMCGGSGHPGPGPGASQVAVLGSRQ